jgi:hypothetical protein
MSTLDTTAEQAAHIIGFLGVPEPTAEAKQSFDEDIA